MKKLLIAVLILGLGMVMMPAEGKAYTNQNVWIIVSVSVPASVVVVNTTTTNWNIGAKPLNFVTNRDVYTIVSNDSGGPEAFRLSLQTVASPWTNSITTNNGLNTYVLQALFVDTTTTKPADTEYSAQTGSDDVVTVTPVDATATNFGNSTSTSTNASYVLDGEVRHLWLKYKNPNAVTVTDPGAGGPVVRLIISATVK